MAAFTKANIAYFYAVLHFLFLCSITHSKLLGLEKGSLCIGGRCKLLNDCGTLENFKKKRPQICSFQGKIPIVCCPLNKTSINFSSIAKTTTSPLATVPISYISPRELKQTIKVEENLKPFSSLELFYREIRYETTQIKRTTGSFCSGGKCVHISNCTTIKDFRVSRPDVCDFEGKMPIVCCPSGGGISPENEQVFQHPGSQSSTQVLTSPTTPSTTQSQPSTTPIVEYEQLQNGSPETNTNYQVGDIATKKCMEFNNAICKKSKNLFSRAKRADEDLPKFWHVVVGGQPAKPKDLTFMVLLGYGEWNQKEWECGGTLISERWILSAAHCVNHSRLGQARWFRLGELVIDDITDDAAPYDLSIAEIVVHPEYGPEPAVYNDIALFKSEHFIRFNEYIKPICLMTTLPNIKEKALAAGWGTTNFGDAKSSALLQVEFDFVQTRTCRDQYNVSKLLPKGIDPFTQLCAGQPGKDTCTGDSGGPLFQNGDTSLNCLRSQVGITSFGRRCGKYPGVYTFLYNYIEWIEKIVWPEGIQELKEDNLNTFDLLI